MLLSGTFGELRSNHFHSGIDIKTKGGEGHNIYSIEKGYVSRIKVSSWGYGKAVYINHENGHTSVYAHLKEFSPKIDSIIKGKQYQKESFEIDLYLKRNDIMVKKGELIAISGNSGSSAGPHLHFEIRDSKTQNPINPLALGFDINDDIAPVIKKIKLYYIHESEINDTSVYKIYNTYKEKDNNNYSINETLAVNGRFAIGISTYDQSNNSHNKNGVYSISMFVDDILYYNFIANQLNFKTSRFINSHIDYKEKKINKIKYHKCYTLPNNKLKNYTKIINNGIIELNDDTIHNIKIIVADILNNTSVLKLKINSQKQDNKNINIDKIKNNTSELFEFNTPNIFKTNKFRIHMQKYSLYESLNFEYRKLDSIKGIYGSIHQCHYDYVPVHKKYAITIEEKIPKNLKEKVYIAKINNNNTFKYMGGAWNNGSIKTKIREFGRFCIVADTIHPNIKGINIFPGKKLTSQETIKVVIEDKESGIKSYRGEINGKWILMDYDYKTKLLKYEIDFTQLKKGNHFLKISVIDNVGNKKTYNAEFTL